MPGDADLLVQARSALLDALDALQEHRDSVIIIGAQAIYLLTGSAQVALAEATKDSDLALDVHSLGDDPLIEVAMERAGFRRNPESNQPGAWVSPTGIPVDLMVPEALAGKGGRRGARIPPHASNATRRATGLEAAVVDREEMDIPALSSSDSRVYRGRSPPLQPCWSKNSTSSARGRTPRLALWTRRPMTSIGPCRHPDRGPRRAATTTIDGRPGRTRHQHGDRLSEPAVRLRTKCHRFFDGWQGRKGSG